MPFPQGAGRAPVRARSAAGASVRATKAGRVRTCCRAVVFVPGRQRSSLRREVRQAATAGADSRGHFIADAARLPAHQRPPAIAISSYGRDGPNDPAPLTRGPNLLSKPCSCLRRTRPFPGLGLPVYSGAGEMAKPGIEPAPSFKYGHRLDPKELRAAGYHLVHVVGDSGERGQSRGNPGELIL